MADYQNGLRCGQETARRFRNMPFLLYTYLLTEMAAPFLATFIILTGVVFLGQLLQFFDTLFALGIGAADFLRLSLYMLPKLMMFSVPLAGMLGVIFCFSRLNADHELLALKAAGIGPDKILPPVIIFALLISLMTGYSSITLMPKGLVNMKVLMLQLARDKIDRGVRERSFSGSLGGIVAYVDQVDPVSGQWRNIFLYDGRQKNKPVTVTAATGRVETNYGNLTLTLHLADGSIDSLDESYARNIHFEQYSFSLPVPIPGFKAGKATKRTEMSGRQLLDGAAGYGIDSLKGRRLLIEYHQRLILAAGCFILTLLGLPLSASRLSPGRRQTALPYGLFCFLLYYLLFSFAETMAEQGGLGVVPVLWAPNLFFFILTVAAILGIDREPRVSPADLLCRLTSRVSWFNKGGGSKE